MTITATASEVLAEKLEHLKTAFFNASYVLTQFAFDVGIADQGNGMRFAAALVGATAAILRMQKSPLGSGLRVFARPKE